MGLLNKARNSLNHKETGSFLEKAAFHLKDSTDTEKKKVYKRVPTHPRLGSQKPRYPRN